jgi:hypothetical protein
MAAPWPASTSSTNRVPETGLTFTETLVVRIGAAFSTSTTTCSGSRFMTYASEPVTAIADTPRAMSPNASGSFELGRAGAGPAATVGCELARRSSSQSSCSSTLGSASCNSRAALVPLSRRSRSTATSSANSSCMK